MSRLGSSVPIAVELSLIGPSGDCLLTTVLGKAERFAKRPIEAILSGGNIGSTRFAPLRSKEIS